MSLGLSKKTLTVAHVIIRTTVATRTSRRFYVESLVKAPLRVVLLEVYGAITLLLIGLRHDHTYTTPTPSDHSLKGFAFVRPCRACTSSTVYTGCQGRAGNS